MFVASSLDLLILQYSTAFSHAFDHSSLFAKSHRNLDILVPYAPTDVQLLLQNEPLLNDQNFFDDGKDHDVALRPHRGRQIDLAANRHAFDVDGFLLEASSGHLLGQVDDRTDTDLARGGANLIDASSRRSGSARATAPGAS
jgi:hypothetical protein